MNPVVRLTAASIAAIFCASTAAAQDSAAIAVARIEMQPASMTVGVNDTARVTAVAYDAAGRKLGLRLHFFSSSQRNLSVDQTGLARGRRPGEYRILAAVPGDTLHGESRVTVRAEVTGRYRDPRTANYWSIIPGGGHLYSGEYDRGIALLGGSLGVLAAGRHASREKCALFDDVDVQSNRLTVVRACERHRGWFVLSIVAASSLWIAGIFDAADSAQRANFRNGWTALPVDFEVALLPDGAGAALTARVRFR